MRLTGGRARRLAGTTLFALLVAFAASASGARPPPPAGVPLEGLKADIDTLREKTQADPAAPLEAFPIGPEAGDEAGRMHQMVRQFLNSVLEVRNTYLAELGAMGWEGILDAARLQADAGMADSRRMIGEARAAMARAEAETGAVYDAFPALVDAARLSERNRRDVLAGFEEAKPGALADMRASFALESETLDQFDAMIDLLDRVKWDVEGSQIVFLDDAHVEAFNRRLSRIQVLTEQLQARQQAALDRAKSTVSAAQE